ncbi:hypothetical protein EVAR_45267_1 [Eumeta japonica]|uniref:Uncharacterized protein n=1 Tax=Eumeta variegata TaxID=151549 RepID=A0A4C1XGB7_EUMVA|nr:hypothetical protein EVAR_45267_1 [Eumeta japonica]
MRCERADKIRRAGRRRRRSSQKARCRRSGAPATVYAPRQPPLCLIAGAMDQQKEVLTKKGCSETPESWRTPAGSDGTLFLNPLRGMNLKHVSLAQSALSTQMGVVSTRYGERNSRGVTGAAPAPNSSGE